LFYLKEFNGSVFRKTPGYPDSCLQNTPVKWFSSFLEKKQKRLFCCAEVPPKRIQFDTLLLIAWFQLRIQYTRRNTLFSLAKEQGGGSIFVSRKEPSVNSSEFRQLSTPQNLAELGLVRFLQKRSLIALRTKRVKRLKTSVKPRRATLFGSFSGKRTTLKPRTKNQKCESIHDPYDASQSYAFCFFF
jgi:hypothetical protein